MRQLTPGRGRRQERPPADAWEAQKRQKRGGARVGKGSALVTVLPGAGDPLAQVPQAARLEAKGSELRALGQVREEFGIAGGRGVEVQEVSFAPQN